MNPLVDSVNRFYFLVLLLFLFGGFLLPPAWAQDTILGLLFAQVGLLLYPYLSFLLPRRRQYAATLPFRRLTGRDVFFVSSITLCLVITGSFLNSVSVAFYSALAGPLPSPALPLDPVRPFWVYLLVLALLPSVLEELVFRGLILSVYRSLGNTLAILVSALLFAFLHLNALTFLHTFLLGLFFGYAVLRTRSLLAGMLGHFLYNGVVVTLQRLGGTESAGEAAGTVFLTFSALAPLVPLALLSTGVAMLLLLFYHRDISLPLEPLRDAVSTLGSLLRTRRSFRAILLLALAASHLVFFF